MSDPYSEKIKVLFILHLPPPVHGAAIANSFIRNSSIINNEFETDYLSLATNAKLHESGKGSIRKVFTFMSLIFKVLRALVNKKYDLCYVSLTAGGPAFYKDLIIVSVLKLFGKKILYHFHNKGVSLAPQNAINDLLYRYAFRNTSSILLSRYLYSDIAKYVDEKDVFYCPYGIPPTGIANKGKRTPDSDELCRLLYFSNMMIEKGVFVLLEACRELKKRNYNFVCHFAGGWTDITQTEFNDYVQKNNLENVVVALGPRYKEEKLSVFSNSDVFIFPTFYHYETFGLVNLEAMQHGLPIVSTPEGGIPDVVVDGVTGFLVPQRNTDALTEKLEILISNPDLRTEMGAAGEKRYRELFTIDRFERKVADIIKEAVREKRVKTQLNQQATY